MENFICIVGCGHSGTTILNKIIGNHKDIHGLDPDTHLFFENENHLPEDLIPLLQIVINEKIEKKLNDVHSERVKKNKKYICEKSPSHVFKLDEIYKHIRNPKIIVMIRDGRDVVSSLNKRHGIIQKSIDRWISSNNAWLNHPNKHFFFILKYEDFVKDKETTMKCLCDYLEIDYYEGLFDYKRKYVQLPDNFFDGLINYYNNKNFLLREYQTNQPLYDGTNRWKKDLSHEELQRLYSNDEFMKMMEKLGYEI